MIKAIEDYCIQIRKGVKAMNTNTMTFKKQLVGQWVMMDNGLVWQWTAVKANNIVELKADAADYAEAA
jgi:hypothetical protein